MSVILKLNQSTLTVQQGRGIEPWVYIPRQNNFVYSLTFKIIPQSNLIPAIDTIGWIGMHQ